jgi:peptide/nickel transport system substrate-binding protein
MRARRAGVSGIFATAILHILFKNGCLPAGIETRQTTGNFKMCKRYRLSTSLFAMSLLLAASPPVVAQPAPGNKAVHIVIQPEPPILMQGLSQNTPTNMVAGNIYESLLRFDEKFNAQPSLAKSWSASPDRKTYTFNLQEGVVWHDGKPFTADDVVFTLDKFLREVSPRWRPIANSQVEKIEKIDDLTVKITLKQTFAPLPLVFEVSSGPIIPKHIYEGTDFRANPANTTPIGTGPFMFKEWKKGSYIHLTKNSRYWLKGKPYFDDLYYEVIPDAAARAVAYQTGKVDVLPGGAVDVFDVARLSKLPNTCMTTKGWEMFAPIAWVAPNLRRGVLGNKQFRQGLMHAIDREFGKNTVWDGIGKVATGPINSKTRFYSADVPKYPLDLEKAKQLIKASGYKGEKLSLLVLPYGEIWNRWAEAVKQNLADVGVNVEIEATDVPGWTQRVANWDFDLTFNFLYQLGDPAIGVSRNYVSSNIVKGNPFANSEGYSNPEVDKLFAEAAAAPTDDERQRLYTKVQQIIVDEVPILWLLELEYPTIYRCDIKDLVTTAVGVDDGFRDARKN